MRRRWLLMMFGAVVAVPTTLHAQQEAVPTIGFLSAFSRPAEYPTQLFRQALGQAGYIEGRNVAFELRFADGQYDRLSAMAADLVGCRVALIVAVGLPAARAAKAASTTTPIVFWSAGDPVADGLVASISRPGGNLTGVATFNNVLGAKRLELLRELVPKATTFAMLVNPTNPNAELQVKDAQDAARLIGVGLHIVKSRTEGEIEWRSRSSSINERMR